jgi:hypothetical protein
MKTRARLNSSARIEAGERCEKIAAVKIRVADQIERRKGRDEAVLAEGSEQVRAACPDDAVDIGKAGCGSRRRHGLRPGVLQIHGIQQRRDRLADRCPVRGRVVPRMAQGVLQLLEASFVTQFRQARSPQQGTQSRVCERRPIEFGQMTVAALMVQQDGVAQII